MHCLQLRNTGAGRAPSSCSNTRSSPATPSYGGECSALHSALPLSPSWYVAVGRSSQPPRPPPARRWDWHAWQLLTALIPPGGEAAAAVPVHSFLQRLTGGVLSVPACSGGAVGSVGPAGHAANEGNQGESDECCFQALALGGAGAPLRSHTSPCCCRRMRRPQPNPALRNSAALLPHRGRRRWLSGWRASKQPWSRCSRRSRRPRQR